jgi:hypothetical protein
MSFSFKGKFNKDGVAPDHTGKGRSWSLKKIKFV